MAPDTSPMWTALARADQRASTGLDVTKAGRRFATLYGRKARHEGKPESAAETGWRPACPVAVRESAWGRSWTSTHLVPGSNYGSCAVLYCRKMISEVAHQDDSLAAVSHGAEVEASPVAAR